jgi:hypothetical protein
MPIRTSLALLLRTFVLSRLWFVCWKILILRSQLPSEPRQLATKLPSVFERLQTAAPVSILKKRAAAALAEADDAEKEARREELIEQLASLDE